MYLLAAMMLLMSIPVLEEKTELKREVSYEELLDEGAKAILNQMLPELMGCKQAKGYVVKDDEKPDVIVLVLQCVDKK